MLVVRLDRCGNEYLEFWVRVMYVYLHENFGLRVRIDSFDILMMMVEKHIF